MNTLHHLSHLGHSHVTQRLCQRLYARLFMGPGLRLGLAAALLATLSACGGGGGAGTAGSSGPDAVLRTSTEPPGIQCPYGGSKIESGLDANRNGQLDTNEVAAQTYLCNAAPASSGAQGASGAPGTPGAPGAAGVTGATGSAALAGSVGASGPAGATGTSGTIGAAGATGAAGSAGAAGSSGAAGAAGGTGPVGSPGTTGAGGSAGATGAAGPAGAAGATGAPGASPTGATGATGAAGTPGISGNAGANGANASVPTSFNTPPAARVAFAASDLALSVSAAASSDAGGTITSYVWNFGEPSRPGNSASGITATHTFAAPGSYQVTLLVTDNLGAPAVNQQTITVLASPVATGKLNDTGITASQCNSAGTSTLSLCTSTAATTLNPTQDGMQGRDATPATNAAGDGKLGFSFTKIAANGLALPASAASWACVKDNVTGMVWEVKTTDGGLRDWTKTYTNFDSTASAQFYNGAAFVNPTQVQIDAATNSVGFKNAVNAVGLCGANDWRLPTPDELQGLVDYGVAYPSPTIDATWFPNTQVNAFWSSSPVVGFASVAWLVDFNGGYVFNYFRVNSYYVRLVRAGQ